MANLRNRHPARRRFLKQSAALSAQVAAIAAPAVALARVAAAPAEPQPSAQPLAAATVPPARGSR